MNLYQDCLDAMGIAMLELKAGSAKLATRTILSVVESLGSNLEVESQELRVFALYLRERKTRHIGAGIEATWQPGHRGVFCCSM
jgi:hypothetical protein